jgi:hypothetical protein
MAKAFFYLIIIIRKTGQCHVRDPWWETRRVQRSWFGTHGQGTHACGKLGTGTYPKIMTAKNISFAQFI